MEEKQKKKSEMGVFKGKCDGGVEGEDEKKKERKTDMDGEP